jgi:thioredoxin-like negative regulator of GroEL
MTKRKVEIFSAGCKVCEETVGWIQKLACSSCQVEVLDMQKEQVSSRAKQLGVRSVPAVAVDGKLLECCAGAGPQESDLIAAGVGQPL